MRQNRSIDEALPVLRLSMLRSSVRLDLAKSTSSDMACSRTSGSASIDGEICCAESLGLASNISLLTHKFDIHMYHNTTHLRALKLCGLHLCHSHLSPFGVVSTA